MIKKTRKELAKEMETAYAAYLANKGEIEVLPYNNDAQETDMLSDKKAKVGNITYKIPELHTLSEAADLYGEKNKTTKKEKKVDLSGINRELIPASLQILFDQEGQRGDVVTEDKESHEADINKEGPRPSLGGEKER